MASNDNWLETPGGARLRLSRLELADLDRIHAMERRSHQYPWARQHIQDSLTQHRNLALKSGDDLVAYAFYSTLSRDAELLLFVVDRDWQGQGLGKRLLERVIGDLRGQAEMIFLEVRPSNAAARALYETVGFNEVGQRRNYYPSGPHGPEDAYIYAMDLAPLPW